MAVWKQSEHVAVIGQNGSGKSYLVAHALLSARTGAVLVLRTKPDDIEYAGFRPISTIKRITPNHHKYVLDVSGKEPDEQARQVARALRFCWRESTPEGGWCIYVDELYYITDELHCGQIVKMIATQGRSKMMSLVIGVQRPVGITRWALSEARHILCFYVEGRDAKTVAEATTPRVLPEFEKLKRFECIYYYVPERELAITEAHRLKEVIPNVRYKVRNASAL